MKSKPKTFRTTSARNQPSKGQQQITSIFQKVSFKRKLNYIYTSLIFKRKREFKSRLSPTEPPLKKQKIVHQVSVETPTAKRISSLVTKNCFYCRALQYFFLRVNVLKTFDY